MAVLVAGRVHDRRVAALGDREEMVRGGRCLDRVDGDPHVAVGAVLEADRARQARRELAMDLALGRPRADRAPADEIGDVLRRDHVEILGAGRQVELVHLNQDPACEPQPLVDPVAVVEVRVVDQTLPADRRARFLEVDTHDDDEIGGELAAHRGEARRIVDRGVVIVDRARAHDDEQPVVRPMEHAVDRLARLERRRCGSFTRRKFAQQVRGRRQLLDFADAGVVDRRTGRRRGRGGGAVAVGSGRRHGKLQGANSTKTKGYHKSPAGPIIVPRGMLQCISPI